MDLPPNTHSSLWGAGQLSVLLVGPWPSLGGRLGQGGGCPGLCAPDQEAHAYLAAQVEPRPAGRRQEQRVESAGTTVTCHSSGCF